MDKATEDKIGGAFKEYVQIMGEDVLRRFVRLDAPLAIPKGKLIFAGGEAFYLLSGIIRGFYLDADGNDVTHLFIFEGSTYGSDFLTTDKPHCCSFEALEDCVALPLDTDAMKECMETNQKLLWAYVHMLEEALKRKILRETSLVTKTATERYVELQQQYPGIEARVGQAHIASYLGINAASLSRIRRVMREEN